jgi:hypothetical protein
MILVSPVDSVIFALINETDKRVYVSYTSRLHQRLGTILSEILEGDWKFKEMIQDKDKLECVILEHRIEKNFVKYFINDYRNKGYYIYNSSDKNPLEYRFRIDITYHKVLVCAVNKRNEREILGEFSMFDEASEFLEYITVNNPTKSLVYKI